MLEILIEKISSLAIIMATGFLLVKLGPLNKEDTRSLSRMVCYLVMPCNIFNAFQMERTPEVTRGLLLVLLAAVLLHVLMCTVNRLLKKPLKLSPAEQASTLYTNAGNLIIPLVSSMLGPQWVIYTCAYILVQNVLTWSHGKYLICQEKRIDWKSLLFNPNIIALTLGFACFLGNIRLPRLLSTTLTSIGSMVGPMAMLVIGMTIGSLKLRHVFCHIRVWFIAALRLLVYPMLCLGLLKGLCLLFPGSAPYFMVSMMAASAPSAALITNMCQLYNRDPSYASSICTVTTTLCTFTIPLMIHLYILFCM